MKISLIQVPYHLGRERVGMGLGPIRYLDAGIDQNLADQGFEVKIVTIQLTVPYIDELRAIADLSNSLSSNIRSSIAEGYFPITLGGNCNTCLGTLAGFDEPKPGIIWFDAHGDYNTPEISPSGFFDGMCLAIATGQCYQDLLEQIDNMIPIQESNTLHVGVRDLDPEERELLESTKVQVVNAATMKKEGISKSLLPSLKKLQLQVQEVYLHIDIDVLDPQEAPGVDYPTPNGLSLSELEQAIEVIGEQLQIKAVNLTAYNPEHDKNDQTIKSAFRLINTIIEVVTRQAGNRVSTKNSVGGA